MDIRLQQSDIKRNEQNHFNDYSDIQEWWLKTLDDDSTYLRKKILSETLKMWDKDLYFIKPEFYKDKLILDAGCGNLRYTSHFKDCGARICVGADISVGFIRDGFKKKSFYVYDKKVSTSNNKTMVLDCENLAFKDNSFDTVLFFHSIHHIAQKNKAINQSYKMLKKGGHIIISDLNGAHLFRALGDIIGRKTGIMSPDENAPTPEEIKSALIKNGFEIREIHYMNPFSEILFHIFNIIGMTFYRLSIALKTSFFIICPIEGMLEKTVSPIVPNLFWRYIIIARKV